MIRGLVFLGLIALSAANIYEFTMDGGEDVCFSEFMAKDSQPSLSFQSYKLTKEHRREELSDLTKAGVVDKRKGTAKVALLIESASGIVYSATNKNDVLRTFKTKQEEEVKMCFKNHEKTPVFVIFDFRTGVYAKDLSQVPTSEETEEVINKLEGVRMRLENSLSLYRQMEHYEEKHLAASNNVLSGVLLMSQILIAFVAIVGWGVTLLLEKSLKNKKTA